MRVIKIEQLDKDSVKIELDSGEYGVVYRFGETTYSTVSDNLLKSSLSQFKKDCLLFSFSAKKLKKLYINE